MNGEWQEGAAVASCSPSTRQSKVEVTPGSWPAFHRNRAHFVAISTITIIMELWVRDCPLQVEVQERVQQQRVGKGGERRSS